MTQNRRSRESYIILNNGWLFSMMADAGTSDSGFVRVASFSDLSKKKKICVKVQDRNIALFLANDSVYALDLFCYRKEILLVCEKFNTSTSSLLVFQHVYLCFDTLLVYLYTQRGRHTNDHTFVNGI